jgi:hypothetical protein
MSLAHHYAERALQFRVSQNTWTRKADYNKMLGMFGNDEITYLY